MPLMLKTIREVSAELGIAEAELQTMVRSGKVRAVFKKGKMQFAPDEVARIKRTRKTLPESAVKAAAPPPTLQQPKTPPPRRPPPSRRFGG
jgi:hypothetical protein